mmetsp:Transcript_3123/g.3545  ORF Transcript_3123/g.3545 Transcript_3123/m.3545 type:complete len:363 (-) Transcript_3123:86-1174(-)
MFGVSGGDAGVVSTVFVGLLPRSGEGALPFFRKLKRPDDCFSGLDAVADAVISSGRGAWRNSSISSSVGSSSTPSESTETSSLLSIFSTGVALDEASVRFFLLKESQPLDCFSVFITDEVTSSTTEEFELDDSFSSWSSFFSEWEELSTDVLTDTVTNLEFRVSTVAGLLIDLLNEKNPEVCLLDDGESESSSRGTTSICSCGSTTSSFNSTSLSCSISVAPSAEANPSTFTGVSAGVLVPDVLPRFNLNEKNPDDVFRSCFGFCCSSSVELESSTSEGNSFNARSSSSESSEFSPLLPLPRWKEKKPEAGFAAKASVRASTSKGGNLDSVSSSVVTTVSNVGDSLIKEAEEVDVDEGASRL